MPEPDNSKRRILFISLSIIGLIIIFIFGLRALHAFKKLGPPERPPRVERIQTDVEAIEDWMTVPFIAHNYGVPPEIIFDALGISPRENHKKSLKQLNDEFHPEADGYVLTVVKATILANQQPPIPTPPETP